MWLNHQHLRPLHYETKVSNRPKVMALKQINKKFQELKSCRCASDAKLYVYKKGGETIVTVFYVNDCLIGDYKDMIQHTRKELRLNLK